MMDRLTVEAAEAAVHPNFPKAEAVLIVELDGAQSEVDGLFELVEAICYRTGGTEILIARNNDERARIWKGRKAAFAAMGRVSPNYYVQDGVIPRTKLGEVLARIRALEERSGLRIGNVFHAGDGNLHPLICYDEQVPGQGELAEKVASEILMYCIEAGGSITGEHGVGADKSASMAKMFSDADLDTMQLLRGAFDPAGICNPGKVFPTPRMCGEVPGPYRQHPAEKAGLGRQNVSYSPPGPRPGLSIPAGIELLLDRLHQGKTVPNRPPDIDVLLQLGRAFDDNGAASPYLQRIAQAVDDALLQLHLFGYSKEKHAGARPAGGNVAALAGKPFDDG